MMIFTRAKMFRNTKSSEILKDNLIFNSNGFQKVGLYFKMWVNNMIKLKSEQNHRFVSL